MFSSVTWAEVYGIIRQEAVNQRRSIMMNRIYDIWGAKIAGPIEDQPVTSGIPTIVLSGEYDPVTSPEWGRLVANTLANATYIEFPGLSHYVLAERSCPRDIMAEFLEDPNAEPDLNCVKFIQFNFITY